MLEAVFAKDSAACTAAFNARAKLAASAVLRCIVDINHPMHYSNAAPLLSECSYQGLTVSRVGIYGTQTEGQHDKNDDWSEDMVIKGNTGSGHADPVEQIYLQAPSLIPNSSNSASVSSAICNMPCLFLSLYFTTLIGQVRPAAAAAVVFI